MPVDDEGHHHERRHDERRHDAPLADVIPPPPRSSRGRARMVAVVAAVVVAVAVAAVALGVATQRSGAVERARPSCGPSSAKLTVQGTGQATGPPDLLNVVVQVSASGPSATTALANDNTLAGAVVNAYKAGGVADKDIQTANLTLQPQYIYPKGVPTVTGYQVSNTITATLHDISSSGGMIDAVVAAGGNAVQIQSIGFSASHPSLVGAKARARATAQAVAHAKALAQGAGNVLGPVCSITDQPALSINEQATDNLAYAASGTAAVPVEAGSQTQSAQVTLVYALVPSPVHRSGH
jgi:uncharacterized protein YggE